MSVSGCGVCRLVLDSVCAVRVLFDGRELKGAAGRYETVLSPEVRNKIEIEFAGAQK
jgi:hypothetical protein